MNDTTNLDAIERNNEGRERAAIEIWEYTRHECKWCDRSWQDKGTRGTTDYRWCYVGDSEPKGKSHGICPDCFDQQIAAIKALV